MTRLNRLLAAALAASFLTPLEGRAASSPPLSLSPVAGPAFSPPATLAAGASWTSTLQTNTTGLVSVIAATSSQAGVLSVQRYVDAAGLIANGPPVSVGLVGGTSAALPVGDGSLFLSYRVTISNTTGAAASLSNVVSVSAPSGSFGGYLDALGNASTGVVPLVNGAPGGTAANPVNVQQTAPATVVGQDPNGATTTGNPVLMGGYSGGSTYRLQADTNGRLSTYSAPTDNALGSLTATLGTYASTSFVAKSSGGNLYKARVKNLTATAGCAYGLNRTTVPATGNLTTTEIVDVSDLPANGEVTFNGSTSFADRYSAGIVIVVSTGACAATPTYSTATPISSFIRASYK